jgi:pantoate--beta-alanine ligase
MLVFKKITELQELLSTYQLQGKTIGFVPTMGALHQGHISLIDISKKQTDITICSIFVNPTQFNNKEDLIQYPRTPEQDIQLLESVNCDILYMPEKSDVYPENIIRNFQFGYIDTILEGAKRPGHFNGVGQVVSIFLEGIKPHKAFFGSKDYQQVMVVKNLVTQLQLPVEIISCPILREPDGLAMSSRNTRLTVEERKIAAFVPKIMSEAKTLVAQKGITYAKLFVDEQIAKHPLMKLEYYEVCDADSLEILSNTHSSKKMISLIALFVGNIRLIDNWMID